MTTSCRRNHQFIPSVSRSGLKRTQLLNLFRKQTLKIAFDALYGISNENIAIHELIELIAYLHFDGKIEQDSKFEVQMSETAIDQFKNDTKISRRNLALCWIFGKAHAKEPSGISIEV